MGKNKTTNTSKKKRDYFHGTYENTPLTTYIPDAFKKLREDFGLSEQVESKKKQQEKCDLFRKKYVCPVCGHEKEYIADTNIMACVNPDCPGFVKKNKIGETVAVFHQYSILSPNGEATASKIFD